MKKILTLFLLIVLCNVSFGQFTFDNVPPLSGGGNTGGGAGYVFNFTTNQNIIIENFRGVFSDDAGIVTVYYNLDKVAGDPAPNGTSDINASNGWVNLGSASMTGLTSTSSSPVVQTVPVPVNLSLNAGDTIGVVLYWTENVHPTTNTSIPTFSDGTVTIIADASCAFTFNNPGSYNPRQFNGGVIYRYNNTADDAGVSALVSPQTGCPGTSEDVEVEVFNYGTNRIDSVDVNWSVNGVLQTPFSVSDTIGIGESLNVVLGSVPFTAGQSIDIAAWTSMPNGTVDTTTFNDTLNYFIGSPSLTGIYTVGGTTPDFATFEAAIDTLAQYGVCGPVTLNVRSGTYTGQYEIPEILGASMTNTITVQSETMDSSSVVFSFPSSTSSADNYLILMDGADYFTFQHLTFERMGGNDYAKIIDLTGEANNNTFLNNEFRASRNYTTLEYEDYSSIHSSSATNDIYNTFRNNYFNGNGNGFWYYCTTGASFPGSTLIIENNRIETFYVGIFCPDQSSPKILNNYVSRTSATSTELYFGISVRDANGDGTEVAYNQVYAKEGNYGIALRGAVGTPTNPVMVYNNFAQTGGTDGRALLADDDAQYVYFLNNNALSTGSDASSGAFYGADGATQNLYLVNNSLANLGGGPAVYIATSASPSIFDSTDYNNVYATGAELANLGGLSAATLADIQLGSGTNLNSVSVDPLYVSNNNLYAFNPSLDGTGVQFPSITDDIFGQARTLPADIGANIVDAQGDDVTISSIDNQAICAGTEDISVTIVNTGTSSLTSALVFWTVDGLFQSPFSFGGTLASGQDSSFVIGSYTFAPSTQAYDIVAWTSLPNGVADPNTLNDTASLSLVPSLSGTYSIDPSGNGDYLSFNAAVDALNTYGVCGPVLFNAVPGVYAESVQLTEISGASAVNTVTFDGADSTLVTLEFDGTSGTSGSDYAVVYLNGADYVTFKNLTVRHTGTGSDEWGFLLSNEANYNTVQACKIEVNPAGTSDVAGVVFSSSEITDAGEENNANYNLFLGNHIYGGEINISIDGDFGAMNVGNKFIRNYLFGADDYGIYSDEQDSLWLEGNHIRGLRSSTTADGIYLIDHNNYTIIGNDVIAPDYGIYVNDGNDGYTPAAPSLVANNMVISETDDAVYLNDIESTDFFHNTVMGDPGLQLNDAQTAVRVVNNIMASMNDYAFDHLDSDPLDSMDYNIYYTPSTNSNFVQVGTVSFTDLADFQANYPSGFNTNSIEGDPIFISATDLRVIGLLADSAATPIGITSDIDGNVRNASFPDIGAYEYDLLNRDVGVTNIPVASICPGASDVIVEITNFGLNANSSAQIFWSVNGVLQSPFSFGGVLPSFGDTSLVIGSYTFGNFSQSYDIVAWTANPNGLTDQDISNDTTIVLNVRTGLDGTYTIDTSGAGDFLSFNDAANALVSYGVCGPVVFNAVPGVYLESVQLPQIVGASDINTITFDGADSTLVTLQFDGTSGASGSNYAVVYLNGADYVTFKNMTIKHTGTGSDEWGFLLSNEANYNTVEACKIEMNPAGTSDVAGVVFSSSETTDAGEENNANYNTFIGNKISGGEINVSIDGDFGAMNVGNKFIRNMLLGADDYGIYSDEQDSLWIEGNYIRDLRAAGADGIYLIDHNNYTIIGNDVIAPDYGIYVNDGNDGYTPAAPSLVANNMVISETDDAVYLNDIESTDFFHNTVMGDPGLQLNDAQTAVRVVNNIMASMTDFAFDHLDSDPLDSMDYNIYYTPPTNLNFVEVGTVEFTDLADFQANYPSGFNTNSLEGNPFFISATDLRVLGTLADSSATLSAITTDIDGNVRNANFPDIGAYEYDVKSVDAVMSEVLSQPLDDCDIIDNEIIVSVQSYGADTLRNVDVYYSVNGAAPVLGGSGVNALNLGDSEIITLTGFDFTQDGVYNIEIFVSVANDEDLSNDTLTTVVENLAIPDLLVNSISAICDSGVATVEVSSTANSINWYLSADTSATLYATGDSVVSPFLTETDTLYAQLIDEQSGSVGPVNNSFGISGNTWNLTYGLYFDVFSTTRIISVDVYPTGSGDIEFIVEDNGGNTVASTIVPITGGSTTVPFTAVLNLTVPPGTDYLLRPGAASTTQVTRNSAGANYPYTLPGVVSITGNAFDGGPGPYYYYFYNWQVTVPGCNSDFIPVVVPVNSSPTVNLGADLEICPGQPETLDADNAGASFAWSTGDTSQVISVSQSGDYSVTITDANSCSASDTASAIVLPGVSVDLGPDTVLCDTAWVIFDGGTGFDSYLWTLNGVVVGNTPMITVEDPGTYYLTATSADGCIAVDSANIAIESCIGIAGVFGDNTINVYPNPNSGQFNLSIEVKEPVKASFSVHDINGKVLYNEVLNLTVGKRTFNYDFDEFLSTGVYLIKFTSDEEHYVERIVVE